MIALPFGRVRHLLLLLAIAVLALFAGSLGGCGDDQPAESPPADDGGTEGGAKVDSGTPGFDGGGGGDADAAVPGDGGNDAADADANADASDAGDGGMPTITIDNVSANEGASGATSFTFNVTLSAASTSTVTVDYATADGTATTATAAVGGPDYAAATGTITFNPGDTAKTVTITVNGDVTNEADETFTVALTNATNAVIGTATGTGTIVNDDAVPTVSIADALVVEGNTGTTPATFAVTLSEASGQTVTVHYQTADGSATAGSDYTAVADTTLTFAPGETTKNVTVDVAGDTTIETNETFTVTLSTPGNVTVSDGTATGTIQNDDGAAQPTISISDVSISEGNGGTKALNFTVSLNAAGASPISVDFATADGTATVADNDYQATSGTLNFGLGEVTKQVSVLIVGDTANENDETFNVVLANATNAIIGKSQGVGTITNDDAAPTLSIANVTAAEGQAGTTAFTFTVTLSAASGKSVSVDFATADGTATSGGALASGGQDYTAASGPLVFPAGTTTRTITVNVAGDTLNEANETFTVTLTNPSNATLSGSAQATGTITNDDALPALVIADAQLSEGNSGTANMTFTVSLVDAQSNPAPSGRTVTVDFATANGTAVSPSDFAANNNTLTFQPGQTQKTINVAINGDTTAEANETFTVTLSNPGNASISDGSATGTILNDDGSLPLLNIDNQTIVEGDSGTSTMTFTVTLSAMTTQNVTVNFTTANGTAVSGGALDSGGQDYAVNSGTLTFLPGETSHTIAVTINGDVANEADETFRVVLSNVSTTAQIQKGTGIGTITNDDALPTLSIADVSKAEGNSGTSNMVFTVTLSAKSGRTVTVGYDTSDGTAVTTGLIVEGGTDYTAANGTLTFPAGTTTRTINVPITGDTTLENDETFTVTLSNAVNATIADATATGTIQNDDSAPQITIADVSLAEGTPAPNTANTTQFVFTVTLSNTSENTVSVAYATANGTATVAGSDYFTKAGTVSFQPGEKTATITVLVRKDATAESNETFFVNLAAALNATISDNQAVGTIVNDD